MSGPPSPPPYGPPPPGYGPPDGVERRRRYAWYDASVNLGALIQAGTVAAGMVSSIFAAGVYVQHLRDDLQHVTNTSTHEQSKLMEILTQIDERQLEWQKRQTELLERQTSLEAIRTGATLKATTPSAVP